MTGQIEPSINLFSKEVSLFFELLELIDLRIDHERRR